MTSERPAYTPSPQGVIHTYQGRQTVLDRAECQRIEDWLSRQIASPAWSGELTEARKASLAALQSAMAASFPTMKEAAE